MLAGITFPPFRLRLLVEIRVILSSVVGFSSSRRSPDPETSDGRMVVFHLSIQEERVDRGLMLFVFLNGE